MENYGKLTKYIYYYLLFMGIINMDFVFTARLILWQVLCEI